MMSPRQRIGAALLAALLTTLPAGCNTCGFDCGDDDDANGDGPALLDLGFSDALPEDLQQVVIEVTGITLSRSGDDEDVVITEFTIPGENLDNVSSFQIDLLEYRGARQLLVVEDLELESGDYNGLLIDIDTTDVNTSSVLEDDGEQKPIAVTDSRLSLSGFRLNSGEQALTVEFGLARALQFREASDDYLLTDNGVRLVDNADSVTLSGSVDPDLFDASPSCDDKADPLAGNRIYLYEGASVDGGDLADVFNDNSRTSPSRMLSRPSRSVRCAAARTPGSGSTCSALSRPATIRWPSPAIPGRTTPPITTRCRFRCPTRSSTGVNCRVPTTPQSATSAKAAPAEHRTGLRK
ncbi:MAG: DUF4382 domain-containing protein [Halioglobus sp.]|nr:DUF4382 domain-containing protein [Halioglobus sp.]